MADRTDIERELRRFDKATLVMWILDRASILFYPEVELARLRRMHGEMRMDKARSRMRDAEAQMQAAHNDSSTRARIRYLEASADWERASRDWDKALAEAYPKGESTR